jgi:hypothetical protein
MKAAISPDLGDSVHKMHCLQHWVLCKLGVTSKHQQIANPSCGLGWTNNFQQ